MIKQNTGRSEKGTLISLSADGPSQSFACLVVSYALDVLLSFKKKRWQKLCPNLLIKARSFT
jgi:transposase